MTTLRRTSRSRIFLVAGVLGVVLLIAASLMASHRSGPKDEGLVFTIPAGAKASVPRPGWDSAITLPTRIEFGPDDTPVITIHNLDDVEHRAGPFLVGPGQTFVQRFAAPGRYPIACTVDPLESIVVTVEA